METIDNSVLSPDCVAVSVETWGDGTVIVEEYCNDATKKSYEFFYLGNESEDLVDKKARDTINASSKGHPFNNTGTIRLYIFNKNVVKPVYDDENGTIFFGHLKLMIKDKEMYVYTGTTKKKFYNAMCYYPGNTYFERVNYFLKSVLAY